MMIDDLCGSICLDDIPQDLIVRSGKANKRYIAIRIILNPNPTPWSDYKLITNFPKSKIGKNKGQHQFQITLGDLRQFNARKGVSRRKEQENVPKQAKPNMDLPFG